MALVRATLLKEESNCHSGNVVWDEVAAGCFLYLVSAVARNSPDVATGSVGPVSRIVFAASVKPKRESPAIFTIKPPYAVCANASRGGECAETRCLARTGIHSLITTANGAWSSEGFFFFADVKFPLILRGGDGPRMVTIGYDNFV
jgi:hypothetical protein